MVDLYRVIDNQIDGGAKAILRNAHVCGPVEGVRWKARWNGVDADIEIWRIRRGGSEVSLVEVSLKQGDFASAQASQADLAALFGDVLSNPQKSKTKIVLDHYGP